MIIVLVVFILLLLFAWVFFRRMPDCGALTAVTGGVGKGKTLLSTDLSVREYKRNYRRYLRELRRCMRKGFPLPEAPRLYSNMPIKDYSVKLTNEHVLKMARFTPKSVVYINEVSFVASSLDCKDRARNDIWLEFFKLIRHETHGGKMFIDTQSFEDCHFSVKRSLSTIIDIVSSYNLGFGRLIRYRILDVAAEDSSIDAVPQKSVLYWYFVPCSTYKLYDTYAYSSLTDDLPTVEDASSDDLKVHRDDLLMKGDIHEKNK